jgi:hypothetical protein
VQPFADQIGRVELVMVDVNGPRKGLGQACRVFVELTHGGRLMFASSARDFYSAASRATFGAGRRLARVLERARARPAGARAGAEHRLNVFRTRAFTPSV